MVVVHVVVVLGVVSHEVVVDEVVVNSVLVVGVGVNKVIVVVVALIYVAIAFAVGVFPQGWLWLWWVWWRNSLQMLRDWHSDTISHTSMGFLPLFRLCEIRIPHFVDSLYEPPKIVHIKHLLINFTYTRSVQANTCLL